jgi:hypothetical protein
LTFQEQVCEKEKAMAELAEQRRQLEDDKADLLAAASCRAADLSHPDHDLGALSLGAFAACPLDKSIKVRRSVADVRSVGFRLFFFMRKSSLFVREWPHHGGGEPSDSCTTSEVNIQTCERLVRAGASRVLFTS